MHDQASAASARVRHGLLPLRGTVLFPGNSLRIDVGRPRSVALLRTLEVGGELIVSPQADPKLSEPTIEDVATIGTLARVASVRENGRGAYRVVLEGIARFELEDLASNDPYLSVWGRVREDEGTEGAAAAAEQLWGAIEEWAKDGFGKTPSSLPDREAALEKPSDFADRIAAAVGFDLDTSTALLAELDVTARLARIENELGKARSRAEVRKKIDGDVRKRINKTQREAILREQLKAIQKELGEISEHGGDELREKLVKLELPDEVREIVDRELGRLETVGQGAEANVIRTYLDWIASLPWSERAPSKVELDAIAAQLDADHEGLADVKKRILEHMAVHKLAGNPRGTILCLVGPPGVGKTSLGESIAEATGRPFVRIALGGVRDEAEIRGHRRTYVGALPGRIIHAMKKAKVKNPVLLLDEIDKLSFGWSGNPEAALLEVLDPEQNGTFTDHYLEAPFDLSEVFFLCTANSLEGISGPLRDRLEIVELSGYTKSEKLKIAKNHLVPKRVGEHGLEAGDITVSDDALGSVIDGYTREAGVRQLSREIARLCRHAALETARATDQASDSARPRFDIDEELVSKILGKPKFTHDLAERASMFGVATGLAWTPVGGDILFIESSRMPGKGRLETTGQLGDVMKESARAALTYVRSRSEELGVASDALDSEDIHIHIPAGAVPKDGPSAGVTIFTALASLLTQRRVRSDTAMTGECTLRGRVLAVGGIKSKVLAAHRAGIRRVILPAKNERDLDDVPAEVRDELEVIFVSDMQEVLAAALESEVALLDSSSSSTTDSSAAPA